jgi:hypothetical protein
MIIGPQAGLSALAGPSALVAAATTVIGAVTLVLFFSRGQPWGTINDVASIVLMLSTIPVVLFLTNFTAGLVGALTASAVGAVGVIGMLGASVSQALLVARVRTYEQLLPWTLAFGAVVGAWYVGVGILAYLAGMPSLLAALAILSGLGYIVLGYGFLRGNERHPLSILGGVVVLFSSTGFLGWIGIALIAVEALDT